MDGLRRALRRRAGDPRHAGAVDALVAAGMAFGQEPATGSDHANGRNPARDGEANHELFPAELRVWRLYAGRLRGVGSRGESGEVRKMADDDLKTDLLDKSMSSWRCITALFLRRLLSD
jgi:hypothetical protein